MRSTRSSADAARSPGRLATTAMLIALGAVLGYLESVLVPALPVPGVRLGLANLAVVVALAVLGARPALVVSLGRVLAVALATGSVGGPGMLLALSGALAAWAVMAGMSLAGRRFSAVGWSVGGAAAHVSAQLAVASLLTGSPAALLFAPVSLALALGCGLAVGCCSHIFLSRLPLAASLEVAR